MQEHLQPFVSPMHKTEDCQWQEQARFAEQRLASYLQQHNQPHAEERQPVDKKDQQKLDTRLAKQLPDL